MSKENSIIPIGRLEYAKGTLSGLLNFSIRSGLLVGDRCAACTEYVTEEISPALRCRCGYEEALETAIRCIDKEIERQTGATGSEKGDPGQTAQP